MLTKEALSQATLEKEVLEEEKAKAAEALAKARRPLEIQAREGAADAFGPTLAGAKGRRASSPGLEPMEPFVLTLVAASPRFGKASIATLVFFLFPPPQNEGSRAELEVALNRLKAEEASTRDSLAKMSALNEGLAQDKTELNQILIQVRAV